MIFCSFLFLSFIFCLFLLLFPSFSFLLSLAFLLLFSFVFCNFFCCHYLIFCSFLFFLNFFCLLILFFSFSPLFSLAFFFCFSIFFFRSFCFLPSIFLYPSSRLSLFTVFLISLNLPLFLLDLSFPSTCLSLLLSPSESHMRSLTHSSIHSIIPPLPSRTNLSFLCYCLFFLSPKMRLSIGTE